jgi:hypothetical protein
VLRAPDRAADGTATWSLTTLRRALRRAPDGLPTVSTHTIWSVLREGGFRWGKDRSWCETGTAARKRKRGTMTVYGADAVAKESLLEAASRQDRLPVWTEDEAGPCRTVPYASAHWHPDGDPVRYPHEYVCESTPKQLTRFHPATARYA